MILGITLWDLGGSIRNCGIFVIYLLSFFNVRMFQNLPLYIRTSLWAAWETDQYF